MVHSEIARQAWLFLYAAVTGAGLLLLYDLLRVIRRVVRHKTAAIAVEDLLFWIFCAFILFGFMYRENEGVIRGFLVLGAGTGMILYTLFASRWIVKGGAAALRSVVRSVWKVCRVIGKPFCVLGRAGGHRVRKMHRFHRKIMRSLKKRLKKAGKAVRIGISKL